MPAHHGRTILSATQSSSTSSSTANSAISVSALTRPLRPRQRTKLIPFTLEIPARMPAKKAAADQNSLAGIKRKRTGKSSSKDDTRRMSGGQGSGGASRDSSYSGSISLRPRQAAASPAPSSSWSTGSDSDSPSSPVCSLDTPTSPAGPSELRMGLRGLSLTARRTRSSDLPEESSPANAVSQDHRLRPTSLAGSDDESGRTQYLQERRLIRNASSEELGRLRKVELVRLNIKIGSLNDVQETEVNSLTKSELVTSLINARKERNRGRTKITKGTDSRGTMRQEANEDGTEWPVTDVGEDAGGEETDAEPVLRPRKGKGAKFAQRSQCSATRAAAATNAEESSHVRTGPSRFRVHAASSPARTRARLQRFSRGPSALRNTAHENSRLPRALRYDESEWADTSPTQPRLRSDRRLGPQRRAKAQAVLMMQAVDGDLDVDMQAASQHEVDHEMASDHDDSDEEGDRTAHYEESKFGSDEEATPMKAVERQRAAARSARGPHLSRVRTARSSSSSLSPAPTTSETGSSRTHTPDNSDSDLTDQADSPSKMRKLRNGKVRLLSNGRIKPSSDDIDDEDIAGGSVDASVERHMQHPTSVSLQRVRRAELVALCAVREIEVLDTDKKADLTLSLLNWWHTYHGSEVPGSSATIGPPSSSSSSSASQKTALRRRARHPSHGSQQTPLLMRSSLPAQSLKPPSPPLTSQNPEMNAPTDGVDELNGLDLELLNLVDKEIPPSKLEKLEKIGSGGFKDVYVGKYHISKSRVNKVAIADIRDDLTEMDIKELSLLRDLRHENIVRFIGVSIPAEPRHVPCMIVSELCSNGDLFDYIRNVPPPDDDAIFRIMLETARGLAYLHAHTPSIIHRDVKSTNVLITQKGSAKINDFGLARVKNTTRSVIRSLVGTVNWQAVELWVPKPHYNEKVDVWSAAMTFWEVLQWHQPEKRYPFQGMNEHQIYLDVGQKGVRPSTASLRRHYGGEIVDLIDQMWTTNPKERPTMQAVCDRLEQLVDQKRQARLSAQRAAKTSR